MDLEFQKLGNWLNLTEQQFQILTAVHQLHLRDEASSPKNIVAEYKGISNKLIQKPNLFTILKTLSEKKLLRKTGQASYALDFDGLRDLLSDKREVKQKELNQLDRILMETEEYFRKRLKPREQPEVNYLDHDALFKKLADAVNHSTGYCVVGNFPSIAYTYPVYSGLHREEYMNALLENALKKKTLNVSFLTNMDVDYLFNHAFMTLGDPARAYRECRIMLQQLRNILDSNENVDVRYHEDPHGLDVAIPEKREDDPTEFIIFTRDEHKNIMGGVHVKAGEPARQAKHMFKRLFNYAEKLEGKTAEKIIQKIEEQLDEKYGVISK